MGISRRLSCHIYGCGILRERKMVEFKILNVILVSASPCILAFMPHLITFSNVCNYIHLDNERHVLLLVSITNLVMHKHVCVCVCVCVFTLDQKSLLKHTHIDICTHVDIYIIKIYIQMKYHSLLAMFMFLALMWWLMMN